MKSGNFYRKSLLASLAFGTLFSLGFCFDLANAQAQSSNHNQKALLAAKSELIEWQTKYSDALKKAKKQKKLVLIDVYTDWCHWCKVLDEKVYQNQEAAEFINKSFVCLKSNAENGDGIKVASKFKVRGFPATIVLKPNGEKIGSISGFLPAEKFTKELDEIMKKAK